MFRAPALLALFAVLLSAAAAPDAPAVDSPSVVRARGTAVLAADAESRWVPFDLTPGNQIRFTAQVDGHDAVAILDTGVSYSLLSRSWPALDAGHVRAGGSATAIGGAVPIGWLGTTALVVGGLTRRGASVTVAALPGIATGSAHGVDLLVGRDLIGEHALDIDYANKRFRIIASGRLPFAGASAPLTVSPTRQIYESEITLGGVRLRPMVVDTGDGSAISVSAPSWAGARVPGLPTTDAIAFGLAGPVVSELAVVPSLRTGQLVARNVEVRVEPAGGFSERIGVAGRIGSGFLQNYRVLLDPAAGRMVLSPGAGADRPPLRSTSGLLLGVAPHRLRVIHVMRGGPGAAAGWAVGDEICAVDGAAITPGYPTSALAGWSAGEPGRTVALGLCDGHERRLVLRRFY